VAVAVLVVQDRQPARGLGHVLEGDGLRGGVLGGQLERGQGAAGVAARAEHDRAADLVVHRDVQRVRAAIDHPVQGRLVERPELVQPRAREQRAVDVVVGILGGGPDQRDQARLDHRQQGVLLGLVEAVDLVQEEDRALARRPEPVAGPLDHGVDVGLSGVDRRELLEGGVGEPRDQAGQGRLAGARRAVEDRGADAVLVDRPSQRLARPDQVQLAGDLVEGRRAQAVGQRRQALEALLGGVAEEVHQPRSATSRS
jgi:hypothetical protein